MALVNHAKKEINAKIVYYGPAGSGKSAALSYIYSRIKPSLRGELKSAPAGEDNLVFFDFSPFEVPLPDGYRVRLHVYTLTGPVTNPATWKMTLKGADGLVVMVDASAAHFPDAQESISQLREFLSAYGIGLLDTPAVLQLNSFDKGESARDAAELALALDLPGLPTCCSHVVSGEGVLDALTTLSRQVLDRVGGLEKRVAPVERSDYPVVDEDHDELEATEVPAGNDGNVTITDSEISSGLPHISLASHDVRIEGTTLRIPLDVSGGDICRRLVITVSIASE